MALRMFFVPCQLKKKFDLSKFSRLNLKKQRMILKFERFFNEDSWFETRDFKEKTAFRYNDKILKPMLGVLDFPHGDPYTHEEGEDFKYRLDRLQNCPIVPAEFTHSFTKDLTPPEIPPVLDKLKDYLGFLESKGNFNDYLTLRKLNEDTINRSCWPFDRRNNIRLFLVEEFNRLDYSLRHFSQLWDLLNNENHQQAQQLVVAVDELKHHPLLGLYRKLTIPRVTDISQLKKFDFARFPALLREYISFNNLYTPISQAYDMLYSKVLSVEKRIQYQKKHKTRCLTLIEKNNQNGGWVPSEKPMLLNFIEAMQKTLTLGHGLHLVYFDIPIYL